MYNSRLDVVDIYVARRLLLKPDYFCRIRLNRASKNFNHFMQSSKHNVDNRKSGMKVVDLNKIDLSVSPL